MNDQPKDAADFADDLARKTAQAVKQSTKQITAGLAFDQEPLTFQVALDELADDQLLDEAR